MSYKITPEQLREWASRCEARLDPTSDPAQLRAHADALEENARLKADTSILHQSIGLLTTIDPAMEVDPVNPLGMAEHLTQYVDAINDRMMGAEAELAKLRQHAEAMADDLDRFAAQPDYDGQLYGPMPSLIAFRASFQEM